MSATNFESTVFVSEQLARLMTNAAKDLAIRAVMECSNRYDFCGEEAIRMLGLEMTKVARKMTEKKEKLPKVKLAKPQYPIPFNGTMNDNCCYGLKQNRGLYTQCQNVRKGDASFCKGCQAQADKNANGKPDYGTIQDRMEVGIYEFKDPKGKAPIAFTKLMKKMKIDQEQILNEAGKLNVTIDPIHFEYADATESKRGRPKTEKPKKESTGVKGRPKKEKKVVQIEDDNDDLFATLVAQANKEEEEEEIVAKKPAESKEDKAAKEAEKAAKEAEKKFAKEAEKAAKEAEKKFAKEAEKKFAKEAEKAAKEAEKKAEKAAKEAAKEAEKAAKEAAKEAEKAAKIAAKEAEKKKKEEEKAAKEAAKEEKKAAKQPKKVEEPKEEEEEEEEPIRLKKFNFEGKQYLISKNGNNLIYDDNFEVIGKFDPIANKIVFNEDKEEEEEEYEEDE